MYEAIGCSCVDIVELQSGELMVWDDEARLMNKAVNVDATKRFCEGREIQCAIRGNVIVADRKEIR
jgi:hypothetical protein